MNTLRFALIQMNPVVGDFDGNLVRILAYHRQAAAEGATLALYPELAITGYPPDDLVLRRRFRERARETLEALAEITASPQAPDILIGTVWEADGRYYNAAALLEDGRIAALQYKHHLPNYGVFDEKRLFAAGPLPGAIPWRGHRLGVLICEDMWMPDAGRALREDGAALLLCLNASPFERGKHAQRLEQARRRVTETGLPLIYVNQLCGQDDLVFDGRSFMMDPAGDIACQCPAWEEGLFVVETALSGASFASGFASKEATENPMSPRSGSSSHEPEAEAEGGMSDNAALRDIYRAMMLGLRDYVEKNGFKGVVLGLSGGIDSALSAAVAADALGQERVHAVMMPSRYTAPESLEDAAACAGLLGIRLDTLPIEPAMAAYRHMLADLFAGLPEDVTEENLQSRIRGVLLMALSNKFGLMLLTTGNKSEMAVGYATLYGDMCGGYNALKDVYKTEVFALAHWRNAWEGGAVIPARILTRPPSAELRPNQTDEDSLPPYHVLDAILQRMIEQEQSVSAIIAEGFDRQTVERVASLLYRAEYKRYQSAPGVKVSTMAFGRNRRYPMTSQYRGV